MAVEELSKRFAADEFSYDAQIYQRYLDELLRVPEPERKSNLTQYHELLQRVLEMMSLSYASHSVTSEQAQRITDELAADWDRALDPMLKSTLLTVATMLLPHPAATDWMKERVREEPDEKIREAITSALQAGGKRAPPA